MCFIEIICKNRTFFYHIHQFVGLLGCYLALTGSYLSIFRDGSTVPYSGQGGQLHSEDRTDKLNQKLEAFHKSTLVMCQQSESLIYTAVGTPNSK